MKRYFLPLFFVATSCSAATNTIPVNQAPLYIQQQVATLLSKASINLAHLSPSVTAVLDRNVQSLVHTTQKTHVTSVDQAKLDRTIKKLINAFVKEAQQPVEGKDIEKVVSAGVNKMFTQAGLLLANLSEQVQAECGLKKESVMVLLKEMMEEAPITMADVSVELHTIFDPFIERLGYLQVAETGKELIASMSNQKDRPKCSKIIIPARIKDTLRSFFFVEAEDEPA